MKEGIKVCYENAKDILPEHLLREIQKYVSAKTIYIPGKKQKKSWGETSGYKQYLKERNQAIRDQFLNRKEICYLSDQYSLSPETIKRIVYSKKEKNIMYYQCSLSNAQAFAKAGKLEEWVHRYLLTDGHNKAFSDGLKLFPRYFSGPFTMPLHLLKRCCGPEANMKYQVEREWFEKHVQDLMKVIECHKDMPPFIVHYVHHEFELNDGNHRLEACRRLGISSHAMIIWATEKEEYDEFVDQFGQYFDN